MQQISENIYFEDAYLGVTVGTVIFPQGVVAIDAPLRSEDSRSWRVAINHMRGGPGRLLISLDAHPDRTLGARALECTIIAHQKSAQVFRSRPTIFKGLSVETGGVWETYPEALGLRWASPDITFSDAMYLQWGSPKLTLESHPGPTPGSIWVVIQEEKTVFVGDTLVINAPPFLAQADIDQWLLSLVELQKSYSGYNIVCGRGGLAKPEDIRAMIKFLKEVSTNIEKLGNRNSPPEATNDMAVKMAQKFPASGRQKDLNLTRLRYGLYQYFAKRFQPANFIGQPEIEDEDI
jgi:glyoxylase-like metal-dependent hydrolase (beta-lactamase superfamily II)